MGLIDDIEEVYSSLKNLSHILKNPSATTHVCSVKCHHSLQGKQSLV